VTLFGFSNGDQSSKTKMEVIRSQLGFSSMLTVDSVGRSGGLALLWSDDYEVDI
jgi:hypothetical protein